MNGISVIACARNNCGSESSMSSPLSFGGQKMIRIRASEAGTHRIKKPADSCRAAAKTPVPAEKRTVKDRRKSGAEHPLKKRNRTGRSAAARFVVMALMLMLLIAGFQRITGASSPKKEQTYKYYTPVTVGFGEDLTDIVFRYCDSSEYATPDAYVREICEINSLPYEKGRVPDLPAGSRIVIPYYDTELK